MILFYDTEATGFPNTRAPHDDERQPHIVQLAAILTEDDGTERAPQGWEIPAEAAAVHGITTEMAARVGVSEAMAFACWNRLGFLAKTHVAHNIAFEYLVMQIAEARLRPAIRSTTSKAARFCTMKAATPIVNLPPTAKMLAAGFNRPKSPQLGECVKHFFNEELAGAHDALVDVRACARVYFHLRGMRAEA